MKNMLHMLKEELEFKLCVIPSMWIMHTFHDFKLKNKSLTLIFWNSTENATLVLEKYVAMQQRLCFHFSSVNIISFNLVQYLKYPNL